jgi:1-pyrroline-5-carboxylate dehydrogenase
LPGGGPATGAGYFIEPTIIADVESTATIFQEEIFGPVLAVTKARDFEHALALANDSVYGLTGAVYSSNPANSTRRASHFHVGNLYLNRKCTGAMVGAHPFGGFNMSGTDSKAGGPGLSAPVPASQIHRREGRVIGRREFIALAAATAWWALR